MNSRRLPNQGETFHFIMFFLVAVREQVVKTVPFFEVKDLWPHVCRKSREHRTQEKELGGPKKGLVEIVVVCIV